MLIPLKGYIAFSITVISQLKPIILIKSFHLHPKQRNELQDFKQKLCKLLHTEYLQHESLKELLQNVVQRKLKLTFLENI